MSIASKWDFWSPDGTGEREQDQGRINETGETGAGGRSDLADALDQGRISMHIVVRGELATGNLSRRAWTLAARLSGHRLWSLEARLAKAAEELQVA